MTRSQEIYRKQLLARIHTHPQYKIIKDNDAWSDWLSVRFGVSSSKELSLKELNKILDILNNKCEDEIDLKPDFTGRNMIKSDKITTKQNQKIYVLANELCWNEMKLLRFVKRQIGYYVLTLKALSKKQANKVIIGLEKVLISQTSKTRLFASHPLATRLRYEGDKPHRLDPALKTNIGNSDEN